MQNGFSFLEILLALFILSFCLLGIAGLQNIALKDTQEAYFRSIATLQDMNIAEQSLIQFVSDKEVMAWNKSNAKLLPQGKGKFKRLKNYNKVELNWQGHFNANNSVVLAVHKK